MKKTLPIASYGHRFRAARIRLRAAILLVCSIVAVFSLLFVLKKVRDRQIAVESLAAARMAASQQDWEKAVFEYRRCLEKDIGNSAALREFANSVLHLRPLERGAMGGAHDALARLYDEGKATPLELERIRELRLALKLHDDIITQARRALAIDPDDCRASVWLARAQAGSGYQPRAREAIQTLLERFESDRPFAAANRASFAQANELCAQLLIASAAADGPREAVERLDRASAILPDCAEVALTRAKIRRSRAGSFGQAESTDAALAKIDLEQAEAGTFSDPLAMIELAAEWAEHNELDRARLVLEKADQTPAQVIADRGFDSDDWIVARYVCEAEIDLRSGNTSAIRERTDQIVSAIKTKQQRLRMLPTAARVYLTLGLVDAARPVVADFVALQSALHANREDEAAILEARLAQIEDRPEEVVRLLEPTVIRNADLLDCFRMLAAAYDKLDNPTAAARAISRVVTKMPQDALAGRMLVRAHLRRGDLPSAIDAARTLESLNPTDNALKTLRLSAELSDTIDRGGRPDAAWIETQTNLLQQLLEKSPRQAELLILSARLAAISEKAEAADRIFEQAIAESDDPRSAKLSYVSFLLANNRVPKAIEIAQANSSAAPDSAAVWHSLCDARLAGGELNAAIAALDEGAKRVNSRRERGMLISRAAQIEFGADRRAAAIDRLIAQAQSDPTDTRSRSLLLTIPEAGSKVASEQLLRELCVLCGDNAPLCKLHRAGRAFHSTDWRERRDEIERLLRDCIAARSDWSAPVLLLGDLFEQSNMPPAAEEIYRAALARNPGAADIADRLLRLLDATNRLGEAPAILNHLTLRPRVAGAFRVAAAFSAGNFSAAIDEARTRVSADPRDAQARILLARLLYFINRDATSALQQLDAALQLSPESMAARFLRVSILRSENRDSDAVAFLDDDVATRNTADAILLRAQFLAFTGDRDAAARDYRKLAEIMPDGAGFELLGAYLLDQQLRGDALRAWQTGLASHPGNRAIKRRLMKELLLGSESERAQGLAYLRELEIAAPRDPDLMRVRAFALREWGGADGARKAAELLEKAIAQEPAAADAHKALIGMAFDRRDFAAARTLALRAVGAIPDDLSLVAYRAAAELALGSTAIARELSISILRRDARNPDAATILLQTAVALRNPDGLLEAERLTTIARSQHAQNEDLLLAAARALRTLGRNDAAVETIVGLLDSRTDQPLTNARIELVQALIGESRFVEAECVLSEALQVAPSDPRLTSLRAVLDAAQGRHDAAFGRLARVRNDDAAFRRLRLVTAALMCDSSEPSHRELGLSLLIDATKDDDAADALTALAEGFVRTGRVQLAEGVYREILAADPRNTRALNDLAWLCLRRGDFVAGLDYADRGLRIRPSDDTLLDTRGTILAELPQRLRDARMDFERASVLRRYRPEARARSLLRLGDVCLRMEDAACARRALDEIRQLQENHRVLSAEQQEEFETLDTKLGRLAADPRAIATREVQK